MTSPFSLLRSPVAKPEEEDASQSRFSLFRPRVDGGGGAAGLGSPEASAFSLAVAAEQSGGIPSTQDLIAGGLVGSGESVTATAAGAAKLADLAVPGEGPAKRLSDRLRTHGQAISMATPESGAGQVGRVGGRIATDLAQIMLTGRAIPGPAAVRGIAASVPVAGAQALGGEESSTAALLSEFIDSDVLSSIAADPVKRGLFEAGLDAALGVAGESAVTLIKGSRQARQAALELAQRIESESQGLQRIGARQRAGRAGQAEATDLAAAQRGVGDVEAGRAAQGPIGEEVGFLRRQGDQAQVKQEEIDAIRATAERREVRLAEPQSQAALDAQEFNRTVAEGQGRAQRKAELPSSLQRTVDRLNERGAVPAMPTNAPSTVTPGGVLPTLTTTSAGALTGAGLDEENRGRGAVLGGLAGLGVGAASMRGLQRAARGADEIPAIGRALSSEEGAVRQAAKRDPATGMIADDVRAVEPTFERRGRPSPEPRPDVLERRLSGEAGAVPIGPRRGKPNPFKDVGPVEPAEATPLRRRKPLSHPRPVGVRKPIEDVQVQVNRFGLDEAGTEQLTREVASLNQSGDYKPKAVTWKEQDALAAKLGDMDIERAWVNNDMDGITLKALKNSYQTNDLTIRQLYRNLEQLQAGPGGKEVAGRLDRLQFRINDLEFRNRRYIKMYMPGASQTARDLNYLKSMASKRVTPDNSFYWRTQATKLLGRDLVTEEEEIILGILKSGDEAKLLRTITSWKKPTKWWSIEGLNHIRRAFMLLGGRTQTKNFLSNTSETVLKAADDPAAVMFDRMASRFITGDRSMVRIPLRERARASRMGAQRAFGTRAKGFRDGFIARSMRGELSVGERRKLDMFREMTLNNRFLDAATKFSFRAQGAADQVHRQAATMTSLWEQAAYLHRGLKGEAREVAIERTMRGSLQAESSGIPDDMVLQAIADGEDAVFQNKTALGELVRRGKGGVRQLGAGQGFGARLARGTTHAIEFIVPYSQTPSAVLTRIVERTPVGLVSALTDFAKLNKMVKAGIPTDEIMALQRSAAKTFGRGTTGTLGILAGFALAARGKMSGAWPTDSKESQRWIQGDKTEDSILYKDRWWRLSGISPAGNLLAIGAQMYHDALNPDYKPSEPIDFQKGVEWAYNSVPSAMIDLPMGTLNTFLEQSFMRGTQDFVDAVQNRQGERTGYGGRALGSWVPTAISDFARVMDPVVRDVTTMGEGVKARVPFWSMSVPAKLDEFGRPKVLRPKMSSRAIRMIDSFDARPSREDPVLDEFNRVNATVSRRGKRQGETSEDFRARRAREGTQETKAISDMMEDPRYRRLGVEQQAAALEGLIGRVRGVMTTADRDTRTRVPRTWGIQVTRAINSARNP